MTSRLRRGFGASAVLLALLALIWMRTDIAAMRKAAEASIASGLGATISVGSQHLSFFPTFGVHLEKVVIRHPDWQVASDEVLIHVGLLPLLFGKVELQQVEFVSPHFHLNNLASADAQAARLSALPFERLRIHHGALQLDDHPPLIEDFELDVRDIGRNRDVLWESQAMLDGQLLRSYGRVSMRGGSVHGGFGKLKLEQVPAMRLASLLPAGIALRLKPTTALSGSGTWELRPDRTWSLFGDLHLFDAGRELGQARGKLQRTGEGQFAWQDSFLHIGDRAVIAVSGSCDHGVCDSRLKADNVPLDFLLPFWVRQVRQPEQWKGDLGFDARAHWQGSLWQVEGSARFGRSRMSFGDRVFELPAARLEFDKLSGKGRLWALADGKLQLDRSDEALAINVSQPDAEALEAQVSAPQLTGVWRPMGNVLLASLGEAPLLRGEGVARGSLDVRLSGRQKIGIGLQADLSGAHLAYDDWLDKPAGMTTTFSVDLESDARQLRSLALHDVRLAGSSLRLAAWNRHKDGGGWQLHDVKVDLDALASAGVRLPGSFASGGTISGNAKGEMVRDDGTSMLLPASFQGVLDLHHFGIGGWRWTGRLRGDGKALQSAGLRLEGAAGYALVDMDWNFPSNVRADIRSADLDWQTLPSPPPMWGGLTIRGRIHQARLRIVRNDWQKLQGNYRWQQGKMRLMQMKGRLAGGNISVNSLSLQPESGRLGVQGDLQLQNVHLESVRGLQDFAASEVRGRLYANLKLDGALPLKGLQGWRADGDVVIYDGYRLPKFDAGNAAVDGALPAWAKLYAFRQLDAHLDWKLDRLKITGIRLKQMGDLYQGQALVAANGAISGSVRDTARGESYRLSGEWPRVIWESTEPRR